MSLSPHRCVVIVGAGLTGYACAVTLRKLEFTGKIVLVGDEPCLPYDRPALSKRLMFDAASPIFLCSKEDLDAQGITLRVDSKAVSIARGERRLLLSDGGALDYDALVLATGGRARRLPAHVDHEAVLYLRNLDDARVVSQHMKGTGTLAIIGGGWIGLEVAAAASACGICTTLIEGQNALCARSAPPFLSRALAQLHASRGVRILLGTAVDGIRRLPDTMVIALAGGQQIVADNVLAGIGLEPNDEIAERAGLDVRQGVRVDRGGRTSDPFIFAGGDVACLVEDDGSEVRMESWDNARQSGESIAHTLMGLPQGTRRAPWFWSDQADVNIQLTGDLKASGTWIRRASPHGGWLQLLVNEQYLLAAVGWNAGRDNALARRLIEKGTRVVREKLGQDEFPLSECLA